MTITSVRLMFATDNRATPFALRGYFMNIFTSRTDIPVVFPHSGKTTWLV